MNKLTKMRAAPTRTQQQQQQAGAASAMASESWPSQRAVINVSVPLALAVFGSVLALLAAASCFAMRSVAAFLAAAAFAFSLASFSAASLAIRLASAAWLPYRLRKRVIS